MITNDCIARTNIVTDVGTIDINVDVLVLYVILEAFMIVFLIKVKLL